MRFSEASGWTERILNAFGRESTRQSALKKQSEQSYAEATEAKKLVSHIEKTVSKELQQLVASHFVLSPDLAALRQTLRAFLQREKDREADWNAVDRAATQLDEKLRPRGPGGYDVPFDPRYPPIQFRPPPFESNENREYREKVVQQRYNEGRNTGVRLAKENVCQTAPELARFLSQVVYSINSSDGTFSEPVQPCSDTFLSAAAALIEVATRIDAPLQATEDAPSARLRRYDNQLWNAIINFKDEAGMALQRISEHEKSLTRRVAAHLGIDV